MTQHDRKQTDQKQTDQKQTDTTRTRPDKNRIAIVFDFDQTLAADTYDALIAFMDLDPDAFMRERVEPLERDGWDHTLAKAYTLLRESRSRPPERRLTRERVQAFGRELQLYDGVREMFGRVRERARRASPDVDVEFYVLSSGFADIIRATGIADEFRGIFGCDFHYDEHGELEFLRQAVSHTEKPRYLHLITKGVDAWADAAPYELFQQVPEEQLHVPFDQVVYVGDGSSDVPCFALLNDNHGIALGVNKKGTDLNWGVDGRVTEQERVENIAPASYTEDSELLRSILLAVDSICARIAISIQSRGE